MNTFQTIGNTKIIEKQTEWNVVAKELEEENLKLMSYDHTLINCKPHLWSVVFLLVGF